MKIIKAKFKQIKQIFDNYKLCKFKLKECEKINRYLNAQNKRYNKEFNNIKDS